MLLDKVAFWISVVFHPLFYFVYVLLLSFWIVPGNMAGAELVPLLIFFCLLILNTIFFPLIGSYLLTGSLYLEDNAKRVPAYFVTIFFYTLAYFFLLRMPFYDFLKVFMLSIILCLLVLALLNLRWKISMHTTACGSLLAFFAHQFYRMPDIFFIPLVVTVIIAGLVGSARLRLQAHNNIEVYAGYITGFTITGLVMGSAGV